MSDTSRYAQKASLWRILFGFGKPVHPSAPWTEQPWAYLNSIPIHYQIHGTDPDAEVLPDSSNVEHVYPLMSRKKQMDYTRKLLKLQQGDWNDMSLLERRASYYIAFGPHGPRKPLTPPGMWKHVAKIVTTGIVVSGGIWLYLRSTMVGSHTMTREWQEATNEIARKRHANPITGISSDRKNKRDFVQSE